MMIEEAIVHCEDIVNDENLINCDDCKADHKQLAEWLKELIKLRKEKQNSGWIPCSERLPEEGQRVLCTHWGGLDPNLQIIEHEYVKGHFVFNWFMDNDFESPTFGQRYMGDVIAWMPLPDPYRGEEE